MSILGRENADWDETVSRGLVAKAERAGRDVLYRLAGLLIPQEKLRSFKINAVRRILVVKEPYRMGDLFQITPTVRALRQRFPDAFIGLVIQDRNLQVFKTNPDINELFLYEKRKFNRNPWLVPGFIKRIRERKFELAVTLETQRTHLTNDLIAYASGAPYRLRYDGGALGNVGSNVFYNLVTPFDSSVVHETELNFGVLKPYGLTLEDRRLIFQVPDETLSLVKKFGAGERTVFVHPGAYKIDNRWPLENFLQVAAELEKDGWKVLFITGPSEKGWESEIQSKGFAIAVGTDLFEMAALMKFSKAVLCNDTGVLHVAGSVGKPTVAIFGRTEPERWCPPGGMVRVVRSPDGSVASIGVKPVLEAVRGCLESVPV